MVGRWAAGRSDGRVSEDRRDQVSGMQTWTDDRMVGRRKRPAGLGEISREELLSRLTRRTHGGQYGRSGGGKKRRPSFGRSARRSIESADTAGIRRASRMVGRRAAKMRCRGHTHTRALFPPSDPPKIRIRWGPWLSEVLAMNNNSTPRDI